MAVFRGPPTGLLRPRVFMFVCALLLLMLPFYQLCHRVRRHINGLKYRQRLPIPDTAVQDAALQGWSSALNAVRQSEHKYVVISVAFGLGNRLRALASAMAVAAAAQRKLLVVWPLDEHCNCSFRNLFAEPLPFALLEDAVPVGEAMDDPLFQAFSYMKSDDSSEKNARINIDMDRHLFVRSAFVLNHHRGGWEFARAQLRSLVPVKAVKSKLVADTSMLGLHVRAIFDAPRPASSGVTSQSALQIAHRRSPAASMARTSRRPCCSGDCAARGQTLCGASAASRPRLASTCQRTPRRPTPG